MVGEQHNGYINRIGLCTVMGFSIRGVETSGSSNRKLGVHQWNFKLARTNYNKGK